jgi:RimJ/RimL family protein N-acetyltransferase
MALWRVRATVDDRPGFLAVLTASLALRKVNILSVQVHATEAGAVDDFLVDAPDALSEEELLAAIVKGRGRDPWVRRADAHGLVDTPTQLIGLAGRVARDPEELAAALALLLGEGESDLCQVAWRPEGTQTRAGFAAGEMALPDPAGGTLHVRRVEPPFTPAEYARAHALVDLAATVAAGRRLSWELVLPSGAELTLRAAVAADLDEVLALHERCSPATRYRRYLSAGGGPRPAQLARLLEPAGGFALVVEDRASGALVALANLVADGAEAEVGLLVQDDWQRLGLGTALLRRVVALATQIGVEAVHAHTHADNAPMIRTMRRLGLPLRHETDSGVVTLTAYLKVTANAEAAA